MPPRARLVQDRSRQRRDDLLDATIALFAEGGEPAISHRAVAARAGVSPATTAYYFGTIQELIDAALSRHIEQWIVELKALLALPPRPAGAEEPGHDPVDLIAAIFGVRTLDVVHLHLSIFLAAARSEALQPKAAEAMSAIEALAERTLAPRGHEEAGLIARCIVHAIGGSALSRLSRRFDDRTEAIALARHLQALTVTAVLTPAELEDAERRLKAARRRP